MHHFLITRFTHRTLNSTVLSHNAFSLFFNYRYFSVSNTNHHPKPDTFTLASFIKSCGLSPEITLKLSKRLQFKNPNSPNAVIQLLKTYGFSDSQLCSIVKKQPSLLLSNPEKTLLPKLKFFKSIGVSSTDLPKILIGNSAFLTTSLKNNLIPRYEIMRSLVRNDDEVVSAMKHWSWNFYNDSMLNDSIPNIEVLRKLGLPQSSISLLVSNFPSVAFGDHSKFVECVNTVKEMGFDPLKTNFVLALQVIAKMDKETWESKLKLFEKFGWSRDICLSAFHKHPQYIIISEKKIVKTMNFLVNDMCLVPEDIARCPGILTRNLEKTIAPRCAVVKILKSKGLIKSSLFISSFILITEKIFLERYMIPFQNDLPMLLDAYKGQKSN